MTKELRDFAETPDRFTHLSSDVERFDDGRVCIVQGATWASVSAVCVEADEVTRLVEQVRAMVAAEKTADWSLGPSSQPPDLAERLRALGFRDPEDGVRRLHAVACVGPPGDVPAGIAVRRADSYDDYLRAMELMWEAFGMPEDRRDARRPHLRSTFDAGGPTTFLAEVDGRAAGVGRAVHSGRGSFLIGGAVLPWARGRGVYRALVWARWDEAAGRGTPALVTQAVPDTSYPILKRLGFVDVCEIRRLEDPR
ncbi:MAG TPA: GNAT family N-acetyltransferase [Gaiellaceae bacterium]|nr:GNAT family N-acetyltransferase [Gaiellaceae bacterium]